MNRFSSSPRRFIGFTAVFMFSIVFLSVLAHNLPQNKRQPISLVPIESLPEQFSNEKLPPNKDSTKLNWCHELIGCFETLPGILSPQNPHKMKFEVSVFTRAQQMAPVVRYEPTTNCLASDTSRCETYPYDLNKILEIPFDPAKRTIVITSGLLAQCNVDWQLTIKDKWLRLEDTNVFSVCWPGGNGGLYNEAMANTRVVARQIIVLLYYLAKLNGLELSSATNFTENIYLVGHSLGAHVSGFVGKDLAGRAGRITGLDPAGPFFNELDPKFRLTRTDAQMVDAMHTNAGRSSATKIYFGFEAPMAHMDYYANDGKHQPNCPQYDLLGCSHKASESFYINFLNHELNLREALWNGTDEDYLKADYRRYNRLFAYHASTFEKFNDGSSVAYLCPNTVKSDYGRQQKDLNECVLPIDFASRVAELREELEAEYNVYFEDWAPGRRSYFFTGPDVPYVNEHNLIRLRIQKSTTTEHNSPSTCRCNLELSIRMPSGLDTERHVSVAYQSDENTLAFVYLVSDVGAKYELAKLSAHDYYLNQTNRDQLITKSAMKFFPSSIKVSPMSSSLDEVASNEIKEPCDQLVVDSITVQPFKRMRRLFSATYTVAASAKSLPDLIFHETDQEQPTDSDIETTDNAQDSSAARSLYLDSVVIGQVDNEAWVNRHKL